MMNNHFRCRQLIEAQQAGHENEPRFMIGEQLKEIAEREPLSAELLERDLAIKNMSLEAAEKHFQKYADENHGKKKSFCITPTVAERLLREFYGLPMPEDRDSEEKSEKKSLPFSINGHAFEIVKQFTAQCGCCSRTHEVVLLSRNFPFTVGIFTYKVKHYNYYCSYTGDLFVDQELKDANQKAINDVLLPGGAQRLL